ALDLADVRDVGLDEGDSVRVAAPSSNEGNVPRTRRDPSERKARATANPMPREPPVTTSVELAKALGEDGAAGVEDGDEGDGGDEEEEEEEEDEGEEDEEEEEEEEEDGEHRARMHCWHSKKKMLETVRFTAKYIHWANTTLLDHLDNQPLHRNHNHNHLDTLITAALAALHRTLAAHLASPVAELPELVSPSQSIRDLSAALIAHYETTPKEPLNAEIGLAVLHLLNTTTTLRGTISAYLSMLGRKPLAFDILYVRADTPLTDLTFPRIHANLNMQAYDTLQTLQLLSDADYRANSGLCFRSIHGTLNHIYMSDLIWYERLHGIDPSRFDPYWVRPDEE
ncbi:hypothetical protein BC830DRAFT_1087418, partial [Chytriomyces sp. MP71]